MRRGRVAKAAVQSALTFKLPASQVDKLLVLSISQQINGNYPELLIEMFLHTLAMTIGSTHDYIM